MKTYLNLRTSLALTFLLWTGCQFAEKKREVVSINALNPIPENERVFYQSREASTYVSTIQTNNLQKYDYTLNVAPFGVDVAIQGVPDDLQIVLTREIDSTPTLLRDIQTGDRDGLWIEASEVSDSFETFIPFDDANLGLISVREQPENLSALLLQWDPVPSSGDIYGYRVYVGLESGKYFRSYEVPFNQTELSIELTPGMGYFISASSFNFAGLESDLSNEIRIETN